MEPGRLENDQAYYHSSLLPVKQPFTEWQQIDLIEFLMAPPYFFFPRVRGEGAVSERLKWRLFEKRAWRQGRNREPNEVHKVY
ncbi:hypothetical protein NPIL_417861 [Nephila pilipes]|uniref:Uncharacterized protein n=1 Tax=Nephila pilipes TaxID=299642 RepID=A0A8X6TC63_NEPPI|nr:hypothetical protein NPIL_417861 [Nephila pilipes]